MKKETAILEKLLEIPIEELSLTTNFVIRSNASITGISYILGFFKMILQGINTVEYWASQIAQCSDCSISAQALQGKLQFRHEKFASSFLLCVLQNEIMRHKVSTPCRELFQKFNRVFLEDSTCVKLPAFLAAFFPGSYNHKHKDKGATARIQLCAELKSGAYEYAEVQSFRDNDQKFASNIVSRLLPGDLVLRDLGYWSLKVFRLIIQKAAFFITRFRYGTTLLDPNTGQSIDLHKKLRTHRLKGNTVLEMNVLVGKKKQVPMRLVAIKAPPQIEQQRKRKANKDRNKKANHSKEYMELLGWTILLTNIDSNWLEPQQLLEAYGFRWRIEIIFKCWKSKFGFANLFDKKKSMTPARAMISFYLLLAWLTLFFVRWYNFFVMAIFQAKAKCLSLFKFADFVKANFKQLLLSEDLTCFVDFLARYCCYSKRKGTKNYLEKLYMLNLS